MHGRLAEPVGLRHAGLVSTLPGCRRCSSLPAMQLEQVIAAQLQSRLGPTYCRKQLPKTFRGPVRRSSADTTRILHDCESYDLLSNKLLRLIVHTPNRIKHQCCGRGWKEADLTSKRCWCWLVRRQKFLYTQKAWDPSVALRSACGYACALEHFGIITAVPTNPGFLGQGMAFCRIPHLQSAYCCIPAVSCLSYFTRGRARLARCVNYHGGRYTPPGVL